MTFRNIRFATAVLLSLLLAACSVTSQPRTVTILHTNDMHASYLPHEAFWMRQTPKPLVGGFVELAWAIDSMRKVAPAVLVLDVGDVMTGNPVCEYVYKNAYGGVLFDMMNMIGYDAWAPGNHDLDISQENLRRLTTIAQFPTISANLKSDAGTYPFNNIPYKIFERGGVKIAVIGIISSSLDELVIKTNLVGLKIDSPLQTLQAIVKEVRPQADIVLALTHQGVEDDSAIAANITGLDVIVGGHSHTRLKNPKIVNNVVIVQAGSNAENLGILKLTVDNGKLKAYDGKLLQLWYQPTHPKTRLSALVDSMDTVVEKDYGLVIGTIAEDLVRGNSESNIGNFLTDAQRKAANADIGFMNTHGIRKDLPAGPVTKKSLSEVLPFRNTLATFTWTGVQVKQFLTYFITRKPGVQTSGIVCRYRKNEKGIEFVSIEVNGKPLDEKKQYTCVANDYLLGEMERYLGTKEITPTFLPQTLFAVVEQAIRDAKTVSAKIENRISEVQ